MKLDNKGFSVIELILSFILVMFLALSMFSLVSNYRNRQSKEVVRRDLIAFKNKLTQDIYKDILDNKVDYIRNCRDEDNEVIGGCVNIKFLDGQEKQLKIEEIEEETTEDGTTFTYESFNIIYGGVKYKNPDPKFAKIESDYLMTTSSDEDNLEYGVLYKLKIRIDHQDLDNEVVIDIVTTGVRK